MVIWNHPYGHQTLLLFMFSAPQKVATADRSPCQLSGRTFKGKWGEVHVSESWGADVTLYWKLSSLVAFFSFAWKSDQRTKSNSCMNVLPCMRFSRGQFPLSSETLLTCVEVRSLKDGAGATACLDYMGCAWTLQHWTSCCSALQNRFVFLLVPHLTNCIRSVRGA